MFLTITETVSISVAHTQAKRVMAPDSKIGVNGTMLYQCNATTFYQSEGSLKPVGSQSETS